MIAAALAALALGAQQAPANAEGQPAPPAEAPTEAPAVSDSIQYGRLRAQAVSAAQGGDLPGAFRLLEQAEALAPNHPGLLQLRAQMSMLAGRPQDALAAWRRLAELGLTGDPSRAQVLAPMLQLADWPAVEQALEANRAPAGQITRLAVWSEPFLAEGVAYDAARDRFLVSSIRQKRIVAVDRQGRVSDFAQPGSLGVFALAADPGRGALWAAASGAPPVAELEPLERGRAALVQHDLQSGIVRAIYAAPQAEGGLPRNFGDLTLGPDGSVYVADSLIGDVFVLDPGGTELRRLLPEGSLRSPQGMAVSPDGGALLIADYSTGLYRLDLTSGRLRRLAAPADASLVGVDGVAVDGSRPGGEHLIVVQNGSNPQRVLRLRLDPGFTRIAEVEVLAANLEGLQEPTGGVALEDGFVFVSRSQWSDVDNDGAFAENPGPAALSQLPL
ncbi:SMP-30/gluconolactonase/LRE family protein [Brevundimonas sp. 2R-24]|uniref:SMP-30/gluconolactonase/LRE family protein n=1 Tax=Peiella sedimenti TaxID=3061083 RepID=A0ABT8SHE1_9CAUL|nr:SMP-30/gluconolactonase/LRE family protein [Caulobacteraceae bacterium XZ-24]